MSASTAIGMVGESLKDLLEDQMQMSPAAPVTLLAPDETGPPRRTNLFLYKVVENSFLKNQDWQVSRTDRTRITPPPLSLSLFYLMTPYAQNDTETGNTAAHEILGEAMRVLHENPIFSDDHLADGLADAHEQIKVMQSQLDLEEMSKVWSTFSQPFRLSVPYEVSVVQLDQSAEQGATMAQRVTSVGIPEIRAPFQPPKLGALAPIGGPVGTVVTVSGTQLDGWTGTVTVGRRRLADAVPISGNTFTFTIPTDLPQGFHQLRIDISGLTRQTFFLEVTP